MKYTKTKIFSFITFSFIGAFTCFSEQSAFAQAIPQQTGILDAEKIVRWSYNATATGADEFDIALTATIQKGFVIYSQNIGKGGPLPTAFKFDKTALQFVGTLTESSEHTKSGIDPVFKINVTKYAEKVVFTQHIKVLNPAVKSVTGSLRFMTCNDKQCLPPADVAFSIPLPIQKSPIPSVATAAQAAPSVGRKTGVIMPTIPKTMFRKAAFVQPKILAVAPSENPIKWSFDYNMGGGAYGISAKATIEKGWYIVSSLQNDNTVEPTVFSLADKNKEFLESMNERGNRSYKADLNFQGRKIAVLENDALFSQHLRAKNNAAAVQNLQGAIQYTVCNSEGCLPKQVEKFDLKINQSQQTIIATAQITPPETPAIPDTIAAAPPEPTPQMQQVAGAPTAADFPARYEIVKAAADTHAKKEEMSAFLIFIQGFLGGLFALFTPCVFPLIPMTVSFFLNRSKTPREGVKNAFLYGLSIILIYVGIGVVLTTIFGAALGNTLATHWLPNLLFFAVFTIFAFSFLGYFELTLPNTWANKTDAQVDKGGFLGIFFMALTLVIVSFSCTGPVLGTLLVQAVTSNNDASFLGIKLLPLVGMLGFSGALALPFGLFALFPSWLKSLPKSGGWMNTLKVNFAFIELLLAVKFLSNIDLVYFKENASFFGGILRWEPFLVLWALLFLGMAVYNFGFIRFPHDDKNASVSWGRKGFGLLSLGFMVYSVYGLITYDPLSVFSGLVPPPYYNFFNKPKTGDVADCPLGIPCHHNDLDEAIEVAAKMQKPLFIDFTGDACVNCRKTENTIWTLPQIKPYIKDSMVMVSLTCDSRTELAEKDIYTSRMDQKEVNKVGRKFVDLQMTFFNSNSQPIYVPLYVDPENHRKLYRLTETTQGYTDATTYEAFLKEAMVNFRKIKK